MSSDASESQSQSRSPESPQVPQVIIPLNVSNLQCPPSPTSNNSSSNNHNPINNGNHSDRSATASPVPGGVGRDPVSPSHSSNSQSAPNSGRSHYQPGSSQRSGSPHISPRPGHTRDSERNSLSSRSTIPLIAPIAITHSPITRSRQLSSSQQIPIIPMGSPSSSVHVSGNVSPGSLLPPGYIPSLKDLSSPVFSHRVCTLHSSVTKFLRSLHASSQSPSPKPSPRLGPSGPSGPSPSNSLVHPPPISSVHSSVTHGIPPTSPSLHTSTSTNTASTPNNNNLTNSPAPSNNSIPAASPTPHRRPSTTVSAYRRLLLNLVTYLPPLTLDAPSSLVLGQVHRPLVALSVVSANGKVFFEDRANWPIQNNKSQIRKRSISGKGDDASSANNNNNNNNVINTSTLMRPASPTIKNSSNSNGSSTPNSNNSNSNNSFPSVASLGRVLSPPVADYEGSVLVSILIVIEGDEIDFKQITILTPHDGMDGNALFNRLFKLDLTVPNPLTVNSGGSGGSPLI